MEYKKTAFKFVGREMIQELLFEINEKRIYCKMKLLGIVERLGE